MAIVAHSHSFVIGVDTHARTHTLAVLAAATGEVIDTATFAASYAGMNRAITWAAARTSSPGRPLWVIEGSGSYGALLSALVHNRGYPVAEAATMSGRASGHASRGGHGAGGRLVRGRGKSDPIDAIRIAAAVLPLDLEQLSTPRAGQGIRAALAVLVTAREAMTRERTRAVNALTALVRTTDLGIDARHRLTNTQIATISTWRARNEPVERATARTEAIRLASRVRELDQQISDNHTRLTELVNASTGAGLLTEPGIGPVSAAIILTVWSHPGRVRSEAAFAALAGVNPIPASSGNTVRHRLNRYGDRQLNRALHTATNSRMMHHPETRAYVQRRRAQGRTDKEIRRCLKRYLARHIYRTLNTTTTTPIDKT